MEKQIFPNVKLISFSQTPNTSKLRTLVILTSGHKGIATQDQHDMPDPMIGIALAYQYALADQNGYSKRAVKDFASKLFDKGKQFFNQEEPEEYVAEEVKWEIIK